jgi:hypothetical protein
MHRSFSSLVFSVLMLLVSTVVTSAQQSTADLSGRVTDSSGGVLPGATVTVTQTNTGLVRSTVTDETGAYLLPDLPTGPYRLEITLAGFGSYAQTGIVLQVGANPTLADGTLATTRSTALRVPATGPSTWRFHGCCRSLPSATWKSGSKPSTS